MKSTIFVSFALVMALDSVWANLCPTFCTKEYMPVCGQSLSTGQRKTFGNSCLLNVENCQNGCDYQVVSNGVCSGSTCPTICLEIYSPVCAVSKWSGEQKTFSNSCELDVENCKNGDEYELLSNGECSGDICPDVCPLIYSPVCGLSESSGEQKTFSNSCELKVENCKNGGDYVFHADGECLGNDCPTICPAIYTPVCGRSWSSGRLKTFSNSCQLGVENCTKKTDYQIILEKECPGGF